MADEDYRDLHARYEGDAVAVLRRLDALGPAAPPPRVAPSPAPGGATPWTRQPVALGAMGAGLLVFGVILGVLVSRYSIPAPPEPEMASPAPGVPSMVAPAPSGGPPRPLSKEMLQGMLQAAHASLDAGRYQEAIAAYTAILRRDPRNVEAITHLGVILAIAGHHADALEAFDKALSIDPNYAHALWDKAGTQEALEDQRGRDPDARALRAHRAGWPRSRPGSGATPDGSRQARGRAEGERAGRAAMNRGGTAVGSALRAEWR